MSSKLIKYINGQTYEYEIYNLVDEYDPVLRTRTKHFSFDDCKDFNPRYLAVSLIETMARKNGIGLAANQCGIPYNVFVMGAKNVGYSFFNPVILELFGEETFEEGCLTFPGLFLPIKRPAGVKVTYKDMNNIEKIETFTGLSCRTILHEMDHLNGVVYTSHVNPIILERCKRKVKKNRRLLDQQAERVEKQEIIRKATEKLVLDYKKTQFPDSDKVVFGDANPLKINIG